MFCYPAKVNQRTHTNPIYTREFGKPTCIGSSNDILAVGSNKGNILLFMMNPDLEFPHKKGKDDTESNVESIEMKYKKYGEVCSLDIREDNLCLVAAFENGSIIIYDIMKMTVIENIPLHTTKILKVKFLFYP